MTPGVTSVARPSAPRWMVLALFASLAVNLIVIGATAGFVWRHSGQLRSTGVHNLPPNVLSYANALPAERRKELWTLTEDERRVVRPLRRELREAREESLKALVAEPFDHQLYLAAQAKLLEVDRKTREAVFRLYGAIAVHLTGDERRGFLRWRDQRRPRPNLLDEPDKQATGQQ